MSTLTTVKALNDLIVELNSHRAELKYSWNSTSYGRFELWMHTTDLQKYFIGSYESKTELYSAMTTVNYTRHCERQIEYRKSH